MTRSDPTARAVPSGRVTRATRMGGLAASVATSMAVNGLRQLGQGRRPTSRDLVLTPANMRRITDELARMRGAAMKIGQLLSMDSGDALPPELAEIMARLRAEADFMPPRQLKRVLSEAWGADFLRHFARFEPRPIAAASIGQVHRATLTDGRAVAVKVQYPGIARSIDSDVTNVGTLIRLSGLFPRDFELAPYLDEARRLLRDEADYETEGAHLDHFNALLADAPEFVLPERVPELTTPGILTMSFVEGTPIESAISAPQEIRDRIATRLVRLMLRELFDFAAMQTDPNFANYRYDAATDRIVLLDFGATRRFDAGVVAAYRALLAAGLAGDGAALDAAARRIGFIDAAMAPAHAEAVSGMIALVFARTLSAPVFDFADTALSREMQARGEALAADGFIPPPLPMDALYLQRKFAGVFLLAARLRARAPVRALVEEAIGQDPGSGQGSRPGSGQGSGQGAGTGG